MTKIKTALISVSDKKNLKGLLDSLKKNNIKIKVYLNSKIMHFKFLGNWGLHLKKSIVICSYPKWREGRGKLQSGPRVSKWKH